MKVIFKAGALVKALDHISRITTRKQTIPEIRYVHCETQTSTVQFNATDLDVRLIGSCEAQIIEPGVSLLPTARLRDAVKLLALMADVTITTNKLSVVVEAGSSRMKFEVFPVDGFPAVDGWPTGIPVKIGTKTLRAMIGKVQPSIPSQSTHIPPGAGFTVENGFLKIAGMDGHRAAIASRKLEDAEGSAHFIIAKFTLGELETFLAEIEDDEVEFLANENRAVFSGATRTFITRLYEGKMPNVERAMDYKAAATYSADRDAMKLALQRASLVVEVEKEKYRPAKLTFADNSLHIDGIGAQVGESNDIIAATMQGAGCSMRFQIEYLLQYLDGAAIGSIVMEPDDAHGRLLLTEAKQGDIHFRQVIAAILD